MRILWAAVCAAMIFNWAFGEETSFSEPILLTSCGQSADVLMMKTLLNRDSLAFDYLPNAQGSDVAGHGSTILVLGGSSKGLGAAKISEEEEIARVQGIVAAAKEAKVPIWAVHLGGQNRRGALSDPFNQLGAENSARIIVVKGGNEDGFFTKIAEEKKIPLDTAETALAVGGMVKEMFREKME